jgi:hypothetical protein
MARGLCRASQVLALLGLLWTHQAAWAAVTLPLEVIGADGTTVSCTVDLPAGTSAQVRGLWMQIHGLTYPNKASVQINTGPWVPLSNETVQVATPGKNYGGIGGAFATLKMLLTLPDGWVVDGPNTLRFRLNRTDGVSIGFRVLAFNLVTQSGAKLLAPATFVQVNPGAWRPPYADPQSIADGQRLWRTAVLKATSFPGAPSLQARCADCHAQDGRDLKYFNYSNLSIIERSKFHGLTPVEGAKIASFIRSRNVPNPGRPWNPPYQPGPGLDARLVTSWAAGAGISSVLDRDIGALRYIFPGGISKEKVATGLTLSAREVPIAMQLPDWNHWLPAIHPKDAWGVAFTNSNLLKRYAGEGGGGVTRYLRTQLSGTAAQRYLYTGTYSPLQLDLGSWWKDRQDFLLPRTDGAVWSPAFSEKVYSTARWQLVKLWELMQEFNLEDKGTLLFGDNGEPRTWFSNIPFSVGPHENRIPISENGIDGSPMRTIFLSSAWYHLQIILDSGNRSFRGNNPVDWGYAYAHVQALNQASGVPEAMRLTLSIVKAMQNGDNGRGPEQPTLGWNPRTMADVGKLAAGPWQSLWSDTPNADRIQVMQALLESWFDKMREYTPQQYYSGGLASPDDLPTPNYSGRLCDRIWDMIPRFRRAGVDGALLDGICDWAKTVWPNGAWDSLKTSSSGQFLDGLSFVRPWTAGR